MPALSDLWWTLDTDVAIDRVGPIVGSALEDYACPVIVIVMDDPYPKRVPDNA